MPPVGSVHARPFPPDAVEDLGPPEALGFGTVARGGDEAPELRHGHLAPVDPEGADGHLVDRRFVRRLVAGSHPEDADGDPGHARGRRRGPRDQREREDRIQTGTSSVVVARDLARPRSRANLTEPGVWYFSR